MNETLTFVLQLREMMSGGMAKIASTAQSVFGGVDKRIAATQQRMSMAGRSVNDLNARLEALTQRRNIMLNTSDIARANREIMVLETRIERLNNVGVNRNRGGGMRMPWWLSGAVLGGAALMGTMAMIKTGADQQRDIVGLSTFMGANKANAYYAQVQQDARITPFVTHDLMAANRMLISTGMNSNRARTDILNLANAVAATGGSNFALERMAQHLQMIRSMGHASYLQLKEFTTNGINVMQLLSDATGKHIKMQHGMTVSYEAIERALAHAAEKGGLFYNALFAQSQTIWGKWSTFVDDLQISAGKVVTSQSSAITGLLDVFDKYAQRLPAMATQYAGAITNITTHIVGFVAGLIELSKWLYHNWGWLKYVVYAIVLLKGAMWAVTTALSVYNTVMTIAAIRTSMLAAAEVEATTAAVALDTAMAATPWGAIALGVLAVGGAIAALVIASKNAGDKITDNLTPRAQHIRDITNIDKNNAAIEAAKKTAHIGINDNGSLKPGWHWEDHGWYKKAVKGSDTAFTSKIFPTTPLMMQPGSNTSTSTASMLAKNAKDMAADKSTDDGIGEGAISGGGSKKIIFNIAKVVDHFNVNVRSIAEAMEMTEEKVEEVMVRLLNSAANA